jgi:uncharacterized protein YabE (DUF348 family)
MTGDRGSSLDCEWQLFVFFSIFTLFKTTKNNITKANEEEKLLKTHFTTIFWTRTEQGVSVRGDTLLLVEV